MKKNKNLFKIVSVLLLAFVITLSTGLNSVSVSANTPYRTYTNDGMVGRWKHRQRTLHKRHS